MNNKLLKATAEAFEEGRSLDGEFLRENNVSADDCFAWMNQMSAIIYGYLSAPKDVQSIILAAGCMTTENMRNLVWERGLSDLKMERALAQLSTLRNRR